MQFSHPLSVSASCFSDPSSETATSRQPPLKNGQDGAPIPLTHFRNSTHPRILSQQKAGEYEAYTMPHPVWSEEEVYSVEINHTPPEKPVDTVHWQMCMCVRVLECIANIYPSRETSLYMVYTLANVCVCVCVLEYIAILWRNMDRLTECLCSAREIEN